MFDFTKISEELQKMPKLLDGNTHISIGFLNKYKKEVIFVFGDNLERRGFGGQAAIARKVHNSYGFVTKKYPANGDSACYTVESYKPVFERELRRLKKKIEETPDFLFLIPTLGNGLANKHNIWEKVIKDRIHELRVYKNVLFLY